MCEGRVEIRERRIEIDGEPRLLIGGEIHYFRLQPHDWQDRLDKLKAAGGNLVASYIPWLCHETGRGAFDFTGRTRSALDLGAFIDLCRDNGLWFLARPGPFVMAELKNEGLPFRLYDEHPEIVPITWDGKPVVTRTVDYLAPAFLAEAREWYGAVGAVLVSRLRANGGNIVGVQLDNEIGMLSWVTSSPDLTDLVIDDFWSWLTARYDESSLARRYPPDRFSPVARRPSIRSPEESDARPLMHDLGCFMRDRFARYVATLRGFAEEAGLRDTPFIVNVHGAADGHGATFPVGISQLFESYTREPGYLSGSDIYLGDLTFARAVDLYLINGFMTAVHRPEQPLTSVEFECGEGDYDGSLSTRTDPSAADFKLRLCVAQGARLVNLYLFAGGVNPRLGNPVGDGNDRIGFTGERHGINAPVGPEGRLNTTYPRLARSVRTMMAVADKLAVSREEHDMVTLGFIPDYYLTESVYPGSAAMTETARNLEANRGGGPRQALARALVTLGFRFGCRDLQGRSLDPDETPVLALGSARFMDARVQDKLVLYVHAGGHLLLHGDLPEFEYDSQPCTVLIDALGVTPLGERRAARGYELSVVGEGWASALAEVRADRAWAFSLSRGTPLLRVYGETALCGCDVELGSGRAIAITASMPCLIDLYQQAFARLGAEPGLRTGYTDGGVISTSTVTPAGERFIHLLNVDGFDKSIRLTERGEELLPGCDLVLRGRDALMLPFGVRIGQTTIVDSTAEIVDVAPDAITFRRTQARETITLESARHVEPGDEYDLERRDERWIVRSRQPATGQSDPIETMTIRFGGHIGPPPRIH